ncbi:MAG: hypothetical protein K1X61_12840 [Chitinophagales bacterium]|nr:hypothetical protein [Chitinophagales bacterium]
MNAANLRKSFPAAAGILTVVHPKISILADAMQNRLVNGGFHLVSVACGILKQHFLSDYFYHETC